MDFTSLSPYVNRYCFYPVDHPDEFLDHVTHKDISRYFGIAKVTVIPPRDLYLAVLPLRSSNKLIFQLCKTCMETEMPKSMHERTYICPHTDQNDSLLELSALQKLKRLWKKGYRIVKIHEVWHFKEKSDQLFRGYFDTFLKLKQQAAGWPTNGDETKSQEYVQLYHEAEGIVLEYAEIAKKRLVVLFGQDYAEFGLGQVRLGS